LSNKKTRTVKKRRLLNSDGKRKLKETRKCTRKKGEGAAVIAKGVIRLLERRQKVRTLAERKMPSLTDRGWEEGGGLQTFFFRVLWVLLKNQKTTESNKRNRGEKIVVKKQRQNERKKGGYVTGGRSRYR